MVLMVTTASTINLLHLLHKVGVRAVLGQIALDGETTLYLNSLRYSISGANEEGWYQLYIRHLTCISSFSSYLSHMTAMITNILLLMKPDA